MANKLTIEEKVKIALTRDKSLRELAKEYGVHHSSIGEIQKESEEVITQYWQKKAEQVGRPAKKDLPEQEELDDLQTKNKDLTHNLALKEMEIDYLKLKLKWDDEDLAEAKIKKRKQLKKNKKQR